MTRERDVIVIIDVDGDARTIDDKSAVAFNADNFPVVAATASGPDDDDVSVASRGDAALRDDWRTTCSGDLDFLPRTVVTAAAVSGSPCGDQVFDSPPVTSSSSSP